MCCMICSFSSMYAGLVVFMVLGFMAHETGMDIQDVVQGGNIDYIICYLSIYYKIFYSNTFTIKGLVHIHTAYYLHLYI